MVSVIQNLNSNLLIDHSAPTVMECSYQQKFNSSLAEKCLSKCLVYYSQVDRSDISHIRNYYGTCELKLQKALQQTYCFL